MKNIHYLLFLFILISKTSFSQNGLEGVIVEKYYISNSADASGSSGILPSGSTTYRVFIDLLPGYTFQAAYGVPNHELRFQTSTSFFNNEDYGTTVPTFSKINARNNTVMLDSWLSGGASCSANFGILKTEDGVAGGTNVININGILANNDPNAGIPLTTQDGIYAGTTPSVTLLGFTPAELNVFDATSNAGNLISTQNASWAVLGGSTGPIPSVNKILIAQFTTNGTFSFKLNIQIGTPTPGVSQNFVAENPTGNEILFPGLIYPAPTNPTAQVSITSNVVFPVCEGSSVTFTASPVNGGASPAYQWKKNGVNTGANSATYTNAGLIASDIISCVMTSSISGALNNPATSNLITAQIYSKPVGNINSVGPLTFCSGLNACTLSTTNNPGDVYQWIKGSVNVAGATSSSYIPKTSASYKVKVTSSQGCSKTSSAIAITVNPLPTSTISVTGPTVFCKNSYACTLTANSGSGFSYAWLKGITPINNATGISYQPNASSNSYKVVVTNSNGCSKTSAASAVTVNAAPTATVTPQGPTTFCSGGSVVLKANSGTGLTYQWLKGINPVAGATSVNYTATQQASYKVTVTNANGCTKNSAAVAVTVNCRTGNSTDGLEASVTLYPNPSTGNFSIHYLDQEDFSGDVLVRVMDMLGREIYSRVENVVDGELNSAIQLNGQFENGMYIVLINNGEREYSSKLLLNN